MASMSALVSTDGRMFYIMDEGSRISIQLPPKWKLIARDAFNGSVLWKRDIPEWQTHLWPLKSGPTQLSRRLVSTDDTVFVTLGLQRAADGAGCGDRRNAANVRRQRRDRRNHLTPAACCSWSCEKARRNLQDYAPLHGTRRRPGATCADFFWNEEPRVVMAFDAESGEQLWAKQTEVSPLTLGRR